jgi:hypothetical protein
MITVNTPCPWGTRSCHLDANLLTKDEKTWIALQISSGRKTTGYFVEKYSLDRSTVNKWVRKSLEPNGIHGSSGRPAFFTPEVKETIISKMQNLSYDIRNEEFTKMISSVVTEDLNRNGIANADLTLSKSSIYRLEKELGIETSNAEVTTDARAIACSEIRNLVSLFKYFK